MFIKQKSLKLFVQFKNQDDVDLFGDDDEEDAEA